MAGREVAGERGPDHEALLAELEASWPLTRVEVVDVLRSFQGRTVILVAAEQGHYVVKIDLAPRANLRDADQLEVLEYLHQRGYEHAPAMLSTTSGRPCAKTSLGLASVLEHLPLPLDHGARQWRELGLAAAELNRFADYPVPYSVPIVPALEELSRQAFGLAFERQFNDLLGQVAFLADLAPTALVHGEINLSNAGRRLDGTTVLLDWDQAGSAPPCIEYGYPLVSVFLSESAHVLDVDSATAFYGSYQEAGGRADASEGFAAAVFHALRYMWWGDVGSRWERILYAADHQAQLSDVLRQ